MATAACCNCASSVGAEAKVQPTTVHPADGRGKPETWCPRCFVWNRMHLEPERFNASQTCAARCQFCHWVMVCYGGQPGRGLMCTNCLRFGAIKIVPRQEDIAKAFGALRDAAEEHRGRRTSSRP